jgi:hypothetical protein
MGYMVSYLYSLYMMGLKFPQLRTQYFHNPLP